MKSGMTVVARRDDIVFGIPARVTAEFLMMNLKVRHRATALTPPAISLEDSVLECFVLGFIQPDRQLLLQRVVHRVVSAKRLKRR